MATLTAPGPTGTSTISSISGLLTTGVSVAEVLALAFPGTEVAVIAAAAAKAVAALSGAEASVPAVESALAAGITSVKAAATIPKA